MLGLRACQARSSTAARHRGAGDPAADPRRGARPARRARLRRHEHARGRRARPASALARPLPLRRQAEPARRGARARERGAAGAPARALRRSPARWPRSGASPATSSTRTSAPATCACCGSCGRRGSPTRSSRPAGARRWAAGATCSSRCSRVGRRARRRAAVLAARRWPRSWPNVFQGIEVELLAGVSDEEAPHREVLDALGAMIEQAEKSADETCSAVRGGTSAPWRGCRTRPCRTTCASGCGSGRRTRSGRCATGTPSGAPTYRRPGAGVTIPSSRPAKRSTRRLGGGRSRGRARRA